MMKQLQLSSAFNWWNKHDFAYKLSIFLTHWGRVTHIWVSRLTIISSDNALSPGRHQAIIWTNAGILLIGPLGTNFSENSIEILTFSFTKNAIESVVCEMAAILSWPQWVNLVQCQPHKWRKCTVAKSSSCQAKWCLMYSLCQCQSFYGCCLTHWGQDKMAAVSQTTFSNAFSLMKMVEFRLKFHWNLFLKVLWTIFQHWFR